MGRGARQRMDKGKRNMDTFAVSKAARSGGKTGAVAGVVSVGTLAAVVGVVRGFWPDLLWPAEQDAEILNQISGAIAAIVTAATAIGTLWGIGTNVWKNRGRLKNGVSLTPGGESVFDFAPKNGG